MLETIILGIVQGITEFLPVSSSGHLEIVRFILADEELMSQGVTIAVVLHFGTAMSTIVIFRQRIWSLLRGLFSTEDHACRQYSFRIVLSMIPAVLVGLFLEEQIDALFSSNMPLVGSMLIITAILLYLSQKKGDVSKPKKISSTNAFVIGISQAIAILPGISRSGATIATSILLRNDRKEAAEFSFLMVLPLILGKVAKDILSDTFAIDSQMLGQYAIGFLFAFGVGIWACRFMIRLVVRARLYFFSIYCALVGMGILIYTAFV